MVDGETCAFVFDPVDGPELRPWVSWEALEEAEDYLARFRRTLKVRLVSGGSDEPIVEHLEVTSGSRWREGQIRAVLDHPRDVASHQAFWVESANGRIAASKEVGDNEVHVRVLYAGNDAASADRTILTIGGPVPTFSFLVGDLDRGPIYLPDYGVTVTWADVPALSYRPQAADLQRAPTHLRSGP